MEKQFNSSGIFSQDFRHCRFLEIQKDLRKRNIEPENFTDLFIFTSMFNDIEWTRKGNDGICIWPKRFTQGHWTFLGPGGEKKWYGTLLCTLKEHGTQMVKRFKDTGHPAFKSMSALSRGILTKEK